MTKVIGVRFRTAGKIYFFSPGKLEAERRAIRLSLRLQEEWNLVL